MRDTGRRQRHYMEVAESDGRARSTSSRADIHDARNAWRKITAAVWSYLRGSPRAIGFEVTTLFVECA